MSKLIVTSVISAGLLAAGCAGVSPDRIAPGGSAAPSAQVAGTLSVMDVVGGPKTSSGLPRMISNDQFKSALVLALRSSGLFSDVGTDKGELKLYATIRSQNQKGMMPLTAEMLVSYKVTDRDGNVVWFASYDSEASASDFSGFSRSRNARERSAKENLTSFLQGIRDTWPKAR